MATHPRKERIRRLAEARAKAARELEIKEAAEQVFEQRRNDIEDALILANRAGRPNYSFDVGDRITNGSKSNASIVETHHENKVYVVSFDERLSKVEVVLPWYEINVYYPSGKAPKSIFGGSYTTIKYKPRSIDDLLMMKYHYNCEMKRPYYDYGAWSKEDKLLLIDSIFNKVCIGKFVFIRTGFVDDTRYEILDGKQRLMAICEFYENKFKYNGLYYRELIQADRDDFEKVVVEIAEIRNQLPERNHQLFLKLNRVAQPTRGL